MPEEVDYVIPEGFAEFFRRNFRECYLALKEEKRRAKASSSGFMSWYFEKSPEERERIGEAAMEYSRKEKLRSLEFLDISDEEKSDFIMYDGLDSPEAYRAVQDRRSEMHRTEGYCAPEGTPEFFTCVPGRTQEASQSRSGQTRCVQTAPCRSVWP